MFNVICSVVHSNYNCRPKLNANLDIKWQSMEYKSKELKVLKELCKVMDKETESKETYMYIDIFV